MSNPVKFEDNQGKVIWLDGDLTLADLLKRGAIVRLTEHDEPLADNWWRAKDEQKTGKPNCRHQHTDLAQIEYGGGYIETCRDCGHQRYVNR